MVKCLFGGQVGLNKGFTFIAAIALTTVMTASIADAGTFQKSKSKAKSKKSSGGGSYSGPETGLLGVKLYDSGLKVISLYGNPDTITTVGGGTSSSTAGGGQGGPPGGFGGPAGAPGKGGGGGGAPMTPGTDTIIPGGLVPGSFGDPLPNMQKGGPAGGGAGMGGATAPPAPGGPGGGPGAPPQGGRGGAPGGPGNPGGAGGSGATEAAVFTRWTYNKNGSKLAFVVDKFDRVIQIEAIGLQNQTVRTRHGIGFGSSFTQVMKAYAPYADPDGYDISGNNFTIRFLTRHRVAFRLTQLSTKKAHVVTGIVVAAGKQ